MARVIVSEFLSADGVMQAPGDSEEDRSEGFEHGGWQLDRPDQELGEFVIGGLSEAGGFLLGRRTYDIFAGYWPHQGDDNPVAPFMNSKPKYVASRTLRNPLEWEGSTVLGPDLAAEINGLRATSDGDILVIGSGDLVQTLARDGLVDEYRLMIYPVVLGAGKRLFRDGLPMRGLRLTDSRITPNGIAILTYEPDADDEGGGGE